MPRIVRLITSFSRSEIRNLLQSARTVTRHPGLDIRVAAKSAAYARVLIVTPRKMGIAPHRNKIRRRIKAIFYADKLFEGLCDLMIYCKKDSQLIPFENLQTILQKAMLSCTKMKFEAPECGSFHQSS